MTTNEVTAYDFSLDLHMKQIGRMLSKAFERYPHLEGLIYRSDLRW